MEDNNTPEAPIPCTAGCGFYGNKIYNNMCSKCFKDSEIKNKKDRNVQSTTNNNSNTPKNTLTNTANNKSIHDTTTVSKDQKTGSNGKDDKLTKGIQTNKGRCFSCRLKIPLSKQLTNKCRCEYIFCDAHRFPDKHECTFDHVTKDKDILAKNNPKLNEKPRGGNSFNRLDSIY
ncbi:hypothetical protein BDB01DRAFT_782456 [Pilobolus umbonatus]|nr:hypothetical protein BDB01DRAFT_782456 [Pilobolus umbonatus]